MQEFQKYKKNIFLLIYLGLTFFIVFVKVNTGILLKFIIFQIVHKAHKSSITRIFKIRVQLKNIMFRHAPEKKPLRAATLAHRAHPPQCMS